MFRPYMAIIRLYVNEDFTIWPKHVVLILTLKNIHLLYITQVVFLTTLTPILYHVKLNYL